MSAYIAAPWIVWVMGYYPPNGNMILNIGTPPFDSRLGIINPRLTLMWVEQE